MNPKHSLLRSYLEELDLIIGTSACRERRVEIRDGDCVASPRKAPDVILEGTSIAVRPDGPDHRPRDEIFDRRRGRLA